MKKCKPKLSESACLSECKSESMIMNAAETMTCSR